MWPSGICRLGSAGEALRRSKASSSARVDAARHGLGVRRQRRGRLRAAAQVGRARQVEPAVEVGEAAPGAHRRHRRGEPVPLRGGVVDVARRRRRRGRGRRRARRARRWWRRRRDAGKLDEHVLETEERRQPVERLGRRRLTARRERLPHRTLAAAGEHRPVAAPLLGQLVEVVDGSALLVAAQVGVGHRRGQPVVALDAPRQHQQVAALGVGHAVLRPAESERQLGAEDGGQVVGGRRLGQHGRAVEAVVVGDREGVQAQPHRLLDQLGGRGGAVEEAEVAVAVQLGVGGDRRGSLDRAGLGRGALAARHRCVVGTGQPAQPALQLLPPHGGVVPAHQRISRFLQS